ncbi:MAG: hypothetical protein AB7P69_03580 [Candidatus Binatia bacterium]
MITNYTAAYWGERTSPELKGAENVAMSLWSVSDHTMCEQRKAFYRAERRERYRSPYPRQEQAIEAASYALSTHLHLSHRKVDNTFVLP